MQYVPDMH
jgi:hypothetical protein